MDNLLELLGLADKEEMSRLIPVLKNGGKAKITLIVEADNGEINNVVIGDVWSMAGKLEKKANK